MTGLPRLFIIFCMLIVMAMRVREWYSWHLPELAKIVQGNVLYARAVKLMGNRENAAKLDFSELLPEEVETELKEAAMGTEISERNQMNVRELGGQADPRRPAI